MSTDGRLPCKHVITWLYVPSYEMTSQAISKYSDIFLAPNGLTVIFTDFVLCYSWNHETAQYPLYRWSASWRVSSRVLTWGETLCVPFFQDSHIRVWDTRTGHLCGKPIIMPGVNEIALSPVSSMCLPMSRTSHNDHDDFDPDNTLSTSARYDFMNKVSCLPWFPWTDLNHRVQRSYKDLNHHYHHA